LFQAKECGGVLRVFNGVLVMGAASVLLALAPLASAMANNAKACIESLLRMMLLCVTWLRVILPVLMFFS
jgi:hypothetical protein